MKEAGLPNGVVNMVFGTGPKAGEALINHQNVNVIHMCLIQLDEPCLLNLIYLINRLSLLLDLRTSADTLAKSQRRILKKFHSKYEILSNGM